MPRGKAHEPQVPALLQLRGLESSAMSHGFGLSGLDEVRANLADLVLGPQTARPWHRLDPAPAACALRALGNFAITLARQSRI
jgi:uncharacterized protein (DUF1810 family)